MITMFICATLYTCVFMLEMHFGLMNPFYVLKICSIDMVAAIHNQTESDKVILLLF